MDVDISAGDLPITCKLKNTDATSHLHIDQRNIPSSAQINVAANKLIISAHQVRVMYTKQGQNRLRHAFFGVINGANTSNLTNANVSKLHCVNYFNTFLT